MKYSTADPWERVDEQGVVYDAGSLMDFFQEIIDPRKARGKRYRLVTLLVLIFLAKLSGADTPSAIADWCKLRSKALVCRLNLSYVKMPHHNTYRRVFENVLNEEAFEQKMRKYGEQQRFGQSEGKLLALDGKKQRGTLVPGESQGEATMALYAPEQQEVLAQIAIDPAQGEIPMAEVLLSQVEIAGKIVLADAMHTQTKLSQQIVEAHADYLWIVKDNQPLTRQAIETLFASHDPVQEGLDFETCRLVNKAHGRIEDRCLTTSSLLKDYLDWPALQQVFRLERNFTFLRKGQVVRTEHRVHYGLTSLSHHQANAAQLIQMKRLYWHIENGLHYRRDVTFHEDATRMSHPHASRNLTTVHNTILSLFARLGCRNAAFTRRLLDADLDKAFSLLFSAHPRL